MATPPDLGAVAPGEGPLDELLAALAQAGEVDSHGAFTLDRQKARQKMQRFQLAQPARYVLELVQAAVLRGAHYITVQIEQNDIHLRCDATPFTLHDYEQIYDALFIRSRADKRQALRHLALGASTALSLKPAWVRIEGGGSEGAYLQLYPGDKERMGTSAQTDLGMHVHVRQRGRMGGLWRILGYYEEPKPGEFELLREHCGLSMVPIEINGLPIAVGYQLPNTMHWMNYHHGNTRGVIGLLTNFGVGLPPGYPFSLPSTMHLLRNCVSFEMDRPPLLLPGFATLVESPSFHLDISHQKVVRNESYEEAVRLVLAQQIQLLVRECTRLPSKERALYPEMLAALVLALLSRLGSLDPLLRWAGREDAGPTLVPRGFPDQVAGAEAILNAQLWPTARGARVSLAAIRQELQTFGTIAVTTIAERGADLRRPLVIFLKDATTQEVFANVFRGRLEDRNIASPAAHELVVNIEHWRKRKQEPRLPRAQYLATVGIDAPHVQGEIAIEAASDTVAEGISALRLPTALHLTLIHQGGVLVVKEIAVPLPGLRAVLASDFSPTKNWTDVEPDERLAAALRGFMAALPALAEQVVAAPHHILKTRRQRALRELVILSRSRSAQREFLHKLALVPPILPSPPVPLEQISAVPIFEAVDGRWLTLDELRQHVRARGYLAVVRTDASGVEHNQQHLLSFLFRNPDRLTQAWQERDQNEPAELPPQFAIWQNGNLDNLREALAEVIPAPRVWDAASWLATTLPRLQQELHHPTSDETPEAKPPAELPPISEFPDRAAQRTNSPLVAPLPNAAEPAPASASSEHSHSASSPKSHAEPTATESGAAPDAAATPIEIDATSLALPPKNAPAERIPYFEDGRFVKALDVQLRAVAGSVPKLHRSIALDHIRIAESDDKLVVLCGERDEILLNRDSAVMWRALREADRDPVVMWFILAAIFTALKYYERVSDAEEAQFQSLLTRHAIAALAPFAKPGD